MAAGDRPDQAAEVTVGSDAAADAAQNARRLAAWEQRMNPVIIVAAILPILVSLTERGQSEPAVWLDLASWAVFIADYVVHLRLKPGYFRSKVGLFDLTIVVLTVPWYVIPALDEARILGLARLGRLGRIFIVSAKGSILRELGKRLGLAALYSGALILTCAAVVKAVEPEASGFESFGDSIWWAFVTFTTVGYGDLFPVTSAGRVAAIFLMIGGVSLIGTLAGSLGSFFTVTDEAEQEPPSEPQAPSPEVLAELRAIRTELAELRELAEGEAPS